ncbi:MAG TPA: hypothetical protein VN253_17005 [Kofleriaceae bacterium]|nr:hypothetical protein [Kofleriaceae bacterium]
MRDLVGEEVSAGRIAGLVLAGTEVDIAAARERARTELLCRVRRIGAGMNSHIG